MKNETSGSLYVNYIFRRSKYCCIPFILFFILVHDVCIAQNSIPDWVVTINSNAKDEAFDLTTDTLQNYYVTGRFSGTADFDPSAAVYNLTSNGSTDIYVAKYTSLGNLVWAFSIGGSNIDACQAIKVNHAGEVIITGYFRGANVDFNPGAGTFIMNGQSYTGTDNGYGGDIFVAKYTGTGNFIWAFHVPNTYIQNSGYGVDVDSVDNIYVVGATNSTTAIVADFDPGPGVYNLSTSTDGHAFIAKYTTTGNFVWAFSIGGWGLNSSGTKIHVNPGDTTFIVSVHVTGTNIDLDPGPGTTLISTTSNDIVLAKYSLNKKYMWGFNVGGSAVDVPRAMQVYNGSIYITGYFGGSNIDFDPSPATYFLNAASNIDAYIAKYTYNGQFVWAKGFGSTSYDFGNGISVMGNSLLVSGEFGATVDFDASAATFNLTSNGNQDIFITHFDTLGNFNCAEKIGGVEIESSYTIKHLAVDTFIICGNYGTNNLDFDPSPTSLNKTNAGLADAFLGKYHTTNLSTAMFPTLVGDTICSGGSAQLTINFGASFPGPYNIVLFNGTTNQSYSGILSGVPFTPIPSPSSTTTYTLISITSPTLNCSSISIPPGISANIVVSSLPLITAIASPASLCAGDSSFLTASGASTYIWTGGVLNGVYFTPTATSTYTVTGTSIFGCTNTATATVAVNPYPSIIASATPQSICTGNSTILQGSGGSTYTWTGGVVNGVSFVPIAASTFTVTGTDANGCTNTSSISISLLPVPTVTALASPAILCLGASAILTGAGASTYSWTGGASNGVPFIPLATTTYTVTGTDANGCTASSTVTLNLYPSPIITANASPASVCETSPTTLTGNGGITYVWSGGITNGISFVPASTNTYTVTGTDANGCTNTSSVTVNVISNLNMVIASTDSLLCSGDSIQLIASGAVSYTWLPNSNISGVNVPDPFVFPNQTTTYLVTGTDANGCTGTASIKIDVVENPKLIVSKSSDIDCNINTVQLKASGANSYSWQPAMLLSSPNSAMTNATTAQTTTFVVTGKLGSCILQDSIEVNVYNSDESSIYIPSAFSPNDDGHNDCFSIINRANFINYYFAIYNRWGQRVFESNNPNDCWNGQFKNRIVELDTYYYFLRAESRCGKIFKKGDVLVIY